MRVFRSLTLSLAVLAAVSASAAEVGTNLDAVVDFSAQYPFVDAFRQSRDWITQSGTLFDTEENALLDLDADGWVKSIPATSAPPEFDRVATLLFFSGLANYPAGTYIVTFDGQGVIEYRFDAVKNVALSAPGRDVLTVTPNSGFAIVIRSTNPANYIRNIRVWMPGFDEVTGPEQVYHPDFLSVIQPFTVLRFMDWMQTNNSPQVNFTDRPRTTDARWTIDGKGVPLETMIDLANRTQKDPWFNMPHKATNDYVTQFATKVKNTLEASRKVYVEYSNEVWNSQFQQGNFVEAQGQAEFPGGDSGFTKRLNWHGQRTAQVCDIWQTVFAADAGRVICVVGSQAANAFTATEAMDCPLSSLTPCHAHNIDAIAIAPYFGGYLGHPDTAAAVSALSLDQLFTEINSGGVVAGGPAGGAIAETRQWVIDNRAAANVRGKSLVSYEGGQHLVGFFGAENNAALTALFTSANRDNRMGDAYTTYLNQWQSNGGELFTHFNNASTYSKFGSWGAVERLDQQNTPKQNALIGFIGGINRPPTANAGADRTVDEGSAVTLAGTGSDPEAGTLTFGWTQISGPTVTLQNPTSASASFTAPSVGVQTPLTFRLRVTDEGALFDDDAVVVTVRDVGAAAQIAFSAANYVGSEASGVARVTLKRTAVPPGAALPGGVSVDYAIGNGSAGLGDVGGSSSSGRVTFAANQTLATLNLPVVNDPLDEPNETFVLALHNPVGPLTSLGPQRTAAVTILDNDVAGTLQFSAASYTVAEGAGTALITVKRLGGTASDVEVDYVIENGTASDPDDYTASTATLEFDAGVVSKTFTVPILQDATSEGPETVKLRLTAARGGATLGTPATALLTINDDEAAVAFSSAEFVVKEGTPTAVITVKRSGPTNTLVTVGFATADGTAIAGVDYTAATGTVTFNPGILSRTFVVPIKNDLAVKPQRSLSLALSSPTNAQLGTTSSATLTINDNDLAQSFQFSRTSFSVGEALATALITVTRTNGVTGTASVGFAVSDGTTGRAATAGADYTAATGTLTFLPGVASKTFTVALLPDTLVEGDETIALDLNTPSPGTVLGASSHAVLNILDNEPTLRFSAPKYTVSELATKAVITVLRMGDRTQTATVDYLVSDGTASGGQDYPSLDSATLTFAPGVASQTFTIALTPDTVDEPNETVFFQLDNPTGGAGLGTPGRAMLTITDDDAAGKVQFSTADYSAVEVAGSVTITVTRTGGTASAASVDFATSNASASGTLTFGLGVTSQTFTVPITDGPFGPPIGLTLLNPRNGVTLGTPSTSTIWLFPEELF
jgi:hypothetical protein